MDIQTLFGLMSYCAIAMAFTLFVAFCLPKLKCILGFHRWHSYEATQDPVGVWTTKYRCKICGVENGNWEQIGLEELK
jgi:hypothetical protein